MNKVDQKMNNVKKNGVGKKPKILLAPMNLANQPIQIVNSLKSRGYIAEHIQYTLGQGHKFGYELDREVNLKEVGGRVKGHAKTLKEYIERDFDIFHFWNKSLFYKTDYSHNTGFDIPLLKVRGKKVLFRFSGFDLRLPSKDKEVNKYSPFNYGYEHKFDEIAQQKFLDFLEEYVDQFLVQDPELQQFCPQAKVIPRALELSEWENLGVVNKKRPLVVHAPSDDLCKGTKFVVQAVEDLRREGLDFDFKLIKNMRHEEAKEWYKRSDIVVDQLLIGATGVLTLEAMALGKPVIVYLREELFKPFYGGELPCINANPDNIKEVIKDTIKDYDKRLHYSKLGRRIVEEYHDIDKVVDQFASLYDEVVERPLVRPTSTRDIDYLEFQTLATQKYEVDSRVYKNKFDALRSTKVVERPSDSKGRVLQSKKGVMKKRSRFRVIDVKKYVPKSIVLLIKKAAWYKKVAKDHQNRTRL